MSRSEILTEHFNNSNTQLRPILTSLNGDNSWLISFPRPISERKILGKAYFHIVSDAWLNGSNGVLAWWVLKFTLASPPYCKNGDDVEALCKEIEEVAFTTGLVPDKIPEDNETRSNIDAIFVNLNYSDHLNEPTLRTFNPSIPVFACTEAATILRRWKHFDTIITTSDLVPKTTDWQSLHPGGPLPEYLNVIRCLGHHELNFATAIIWSHDGVHETLLYSPHGIRAKEASLQTLLHEVQPKVEVLAILHALHDSLAFGVKQTLGVEGGLKLEREARPKYWVRTHDQLFIFTGLVSWLIWEADRTLESALVLEKDDEMGGKKREKPNLIEVEGGGCFVLS